MLALEQRYINPVGLTTIHSIGELDEDGMLLHDALNVLTADSNDALMVLVGNVEGNRGWHFLLNKRQALLHGIVVGSNDVNVEVILPETLEHDLNVTCDVVSLGIED